MKKLLQAFFVLLALCIHPVSAQVEYSFNSPADIEKKDTLQKQSHLSYGISGSAAAVYSSGNDIPKGTTHFRFGHSVGLFFIAPLSSKVYFYLNMFSSQRGFNINYSSHTVSSKIDRTTTVKGYEKLYYLDKVKCLGFNITEKISVFGGMMTSFRLRTRTKYNVENHVITFATGKDTTITYPYDQRGNPGIDVIDFAYVAGVRTRIGKILGLSLRYTRDFAAINFSKENTFKNAYINSGIHLTLDVALSQKMVDVP